MRHLLATLVTAAVVLITMVSPPVRTAAAEALPAQAPAPAPAPVPAPAPPPKAPDCSVCVQCVAACGTAYAECTGKCVALPDLPSKQACLAACPSVAACAQACPCAGCAALPGLPR